MRAHHPPGADGGHHGARARSGDACPRRPITTPPLATVHCVALRCCKLPAMKPGSALRAVLAVTSVSSLWWPSDLRCTEAAILYKMGSLALPCAQLPAA